MRRLSLSRTDRKIAGVCGGIGEYFSLDSNLIRLAFVILALLGFSSVVVYIVCWIALPND
ncbi:MAG: PspC domain-containing protein [Bacillota bacterium]|nr:PspC domain-containing protein [Bacillota bacterium]